MDINRAYKTLKAYEAMCKPICQENRLPQTAFDILMFLGNHPEYHTASEIVEIRGIKATLVSVNVEKLVGEGLLARLPISADRRKYMLQCTAKAQKIIEEGRLVQAAFFERMFDGVDASARAVFRDTLNHIEKNLDIMIEA